MRLRWALAFVLLSACEPPAPAPVVPAAPSGPLVVAVNKQDVPGAASGDEMARRLAGAVPSRPFVDVVETTATAGHGIVRCFRSALVAYLEWGTRLALGNSQADADVLSHGVMLGNHSGVLHRHLPTGELHYFSAEFYMLAVKGSPLNYIAHTKFALRVVGVSCHPLTLFLR